MADEQNTTEDLNEQNTTIEENTQNENGGSDSHLAPEAYRHLDKTFGNNEQFIRSINGVPLEDPYLTQFMPDSANPNIDFFAFKRDINKVEAKLDNLYYKGSIIPVDNTRTLFQKNISDSLRKNDTYIIWTGKTNKWFITGKIYKFGLPDSLPSDYIDNGFYPDEENTGELGWELLEKKNGDEGSSSFYFAGNIEKNDEYPTWEAAFLAASKKAPGTLFEYTGGLEDSEKVKYTIKGRDIDGFDSSRQGVVIEPGTLVFVKDKNPKQEEVDKVLDIFNVPRPVENTFKPDSLNPPSCKAIFSALTGILNSSY